MIEKQTRDLTKRESQSEDVGSKNIQYNQVKQTRKARMLEEYTRDSTKIDS